MTKISFQLNNDELLSLARKSIENKDYILAFKYLWKVDKDIVQAKLMIADLLTEMDLLTQGIDICYEALLLEPNNREVKHRIGTNLMLMGEWMPAFEYLDEYDYAEEGDFYKVESDSDDIDGNPFFEDEGEEKKRFFTLNEKRQRDAENISYRAYNHMKDGNFPRALVLFKKLSLAEPDNIEYINNIAYLYIINKNTKSAIVYCDKAFALDPNNVTAICNRIMIAYLQKDDPLIPELEQRLTDINPTDVGSIFNIATVFCEVNNHFFARKWYGKVQEIKKYNPTLLILYGQACYNCQIFAEAKAHWLDALSIQPENYVAKYYLDYLNSHMDNNEPIVYAPQIPMEEYCARLTYLQQTADFFGMWTDNELLEKIKWAFSSTGDNDILISLIDKIALTDNDEKYELFQSLLIKGNFPQKAKIALMRYILMRKEVNKIGCVVDYAFSVFMIEVKLSAKMRKAYYNALAVISQQYPLKQFEVDIMGNAALNLQEKLFDNGMRNAFDIEVMSAQIVYDSHILSHMTKPTLCKIFDISPADLDNLNKIINN